MGKIVLIVGAGTGLSASLAKIFSSEGMSVALAARNIQKFSKIAKETKSQSYACDASNPAEVNRLFSEVKVKLGIPDIVVYNPSYRVQGPLIELNPQEVAQAIKITAFGAFLVAQEAARGMLQKGSGNIQFTGASASVRGYPRSAPFAMGKFAMRGLAQSLARELHPKNIHISHFIIDGSIESKRHIHTSESPDSLLNPDAIAKIYLETTRQHRSAWAWETELRPWVEPF